MGGQTIIPPLMKAQENAPEEALSEYLMRYALRPQQFLYFLPEPHGHGSFLPTLGISRLTVSCLPVLSALGAAEGIEPPC
jgi:hypothetical protein